MIPPLGQQEERKILVALLIEMNLLCGINLYINPLL
jgi:hypothetical protein